MLHDHDLVACIQLIRIWLGLFTIPSGRLIYYSYLNEGHSRLKST